MWRVSSVLELNGISTQKVRMDESVRVRGRAVHDAAEALGSGYMPARDEWSPWTDGVEKFFADHEPTVVASERRIIDRFRKVNGKVDLVVLMNTQIRKDPALFAIRPWVLDFKTGSKSPFHGVQLGGYHELVVKDDELWQLMGAPFDVWTRSHRDTELHRGIVYLPGDGGYKFTESNDPRERYLFNSALALLNFRHQHGLVEVVDEENPDNDPIVSVVAA